MTEDEARELLAQGYERRDHTHANSVRLGHNRHVFTDMVALDVLQRLNPEPAGSVVRWRCFHCGTGFTEERAAAHHFGKSEDQTPACLIKASEGGLIQALREAEDALFNATTELHAESADGLRALQNNLGRHRAALISAEESGYEKGMRDMETAIIAWLRLEPNPAAYIGAADRLEAGEHHNAPATIHHLPNRYLEGIGNVHHELSAQARKEGE